MKSPKTTTLGILTIAAAALNYVIGLMNGHPVDMTATVTAISSGLGLIAAADHKPAEKPAAPVAPKK